MQYNNKRKELNMKTEKVNVTYYRMHSNDLITSLFTPTARKRVYFTDVNSKILYYIMNGKNVLVPFTHRKELFFKCMISLYPIGTIIVDKRNTNNSGEIVFYEIEENRYAVKNGSSNISHIYFDNATIIETYYFISSTGKIQKDVVGRDTSVERFRKATNNYFENKEEAQKKLDELLA